MCLRAQHALLKGDRMYTYDDEEKVYTCIGPMHSNNHEVPFQKLASTYYIYVLCRIEHLLY